MDDPSGGTAGFQHGSSGFLVIGKSTVSQPKYPEPLDHTAQRVLRPSAFSTPRIKLVAGGWDRTTDRLLMRQPSYHCYTPPLTEATSFYAVPRSGESIDQRTKQRRRITRHTSVENCSWSLPAVTDVYLRGPGPQLAALCGSQRARCKTPGALSQWLTRTAGHPGRQPR